MNRRSISLIHLLREGVSFRRLSDPLHMGKSTVQDCKLIIRYSHDPDGLKESTKWPITDVLYTYLRPLNIRRLTTPQGKQWCIILPPSRSLYRVEYFDHTRRIVRVKRVRHSSIRLNLLNYVPYKCYDDSWFNYQTSSGVWRACAPEFITYITFDMLPDANKPLLYLCCRRRGHNLEVLNLIYISRPTKSVESIPVTYTYDCKFVWIGASKSDLKSMGFTEPPTNYTIEEVYSRGSRAIYFERRYSYDDLLDNSSVTRALRSYAIVKVYIEPVRELGYPPVLILHMDNAGLYVRRVPKICFKKVLLGSRLRAMITMLSSAPIFINMHTYPQRATMGGGLGVRIINSEGFEILFEKRAFRKLIEGIVLSDIKLLKTLLLKYVLIKYCYDRREDYYDFLAISDLILTLIQGDPENKLRNYSKALYAIDVDEVIANLRRAPEDYDRFINYVVEVALNSLAHILLKVITAHTLNTQLKNFTLYVDTQYKARINGEEDEYYAILVLENSHEGLGFIEQLSALLSQDTQINIVKYIIKPALQMLIDDKTGKDFCSMHYEAYRRKDKSLVDALCGRNPDLNQLRDYVRNLVNEWRKHLKIDFPSDFIRPLLQHYLKIVNPSLRRKLNTDAFLRGSIPQVYNVEVPFCWDGCEQCIRLRDAYLLTPIEQIFNLSKKLLVRIINVLYDLLDPSKKALHRTGSGLGQEVLKLLSSASTEIRIMCPWISPDIAQYLIDIAQNKGLKIRIITHPPSRNEPLPHINAVSILEKAAKQLNIIKIAYNEKIHAKTIIIDDTLLITGSMNLTKRGTEINIESITIFKCKSTIYTSIVDYELQWWVSLNKT